MALVNKKVSNNSKKLSQAIRDSRFNAKYFENTDAMLKKISYKRDIHSYLYYN